MKHLKRAKKNPKQTQNSLWKLFKQRDWIAVQHLTQTVPIFSHIIAFPVCVLSDQKERDLYSLVSKRELERFHLQKYETRFI